MRTSVSGASKGELCVICEIVKNLVKNKEFAQHLSPEQRVKLKKYRKQIERLIDRRVPSEKKRGILQRGAGILVPLILGIVAPILSRLILGN